jgi:hypothetical protein
MQNAFVKYSVFFLLLLVYLNRGLFVTPYELEYQGGGELNSVIEWLQQLVTCESNDIDEDGDVQTDYSFISIFIPDLPQQLTQLNLFSKETQKNRFSYNENFILNDFRFQIEQPPEV